MTATGWQTTVPAGWQVVPLRAVADYQVSNVDKLSDDSEVPVRLCNYVDVYHNEFITLALRFMQATATAAEIAKFVVKVGDVIITKDSESWDDIGVPALVRETANDLICGYHLAQIRPRPTRLDGAFLFRCIQAKPIRLHLELSANGVTRFGLPKGEIGATPIPLPPLAQQRAIADFLDTETARIDALIGAKENLLTILAEKRRALVTQAVTRGLESSAPIRDSRIPWLGEIPVHWDVTRLKFLLDGIEQGWSPECHSYPAGLDEWGVMKSSCCNGGVFREEENKTLPLDTEAPAALEIKGGDVLMSRASGSVDLLGSAARVPQDVRGQLIFSDLLYRLRPKDDLLNADYLVLALGSQLGRTQVSMAVSSTSGLANKLPQSSLREFLISVPPVAEQVAIVEAVDRELDAIDTMAEATSTTVRLLRERREAVIAAAVTGQLDVEAA